jgi:hypothetical protein
MPKVFISHATSDRSLVTREIIHLLRTHRVEVWFAENDIGVARHWERCILEGLTQCDWFLVALTPRAVGSEWVKDEVHWAIEERPEHIIPVLLETCDIRGIHIRLPRIQFVDFRDPTEEARQRLLACWGIELRPADRLHVENSRSEEWEAATVRAALADSDREVRRHALHRVGAERIEGVVRLVATLLVEDSDDDVRTTAAWALDQLHDPSAIPALIKGIHDRSWDVRSTAGWALVHLGEVVRDSVHWVFQESENPDAKEMASLVLARL